MKAIVIGATGLVGHQLVKLLLEDERFASVLVLHRRPTGLRHEKLQEEIVNFDEPDSYGPLVQGDVLFSCMGTTLKTAGSKAEQYKVDFTYQYEVAEKAAQHGVPAYVLISASMANPKSMIFYSRMKGELEKRVKKLPFERIHILRPGLLAGERQEKRVAESISARLMKPISNIPGLGHLRPIQGKEVAQAMISAALQEGHNIFYHSAGELFALSKQYIGKAQT